MTDPSAFWCTRTAPSASRRPSCAGHRDAWQFDGSRWPGPESKRTGPRPTHQKTLGSSEEDRHHQLSLHWACDSRRRGGFPHLSCGRWPLVQHTDCGSRRWHSVPADPWCALGPPAVGVEVCVCTAGPQEWSLWCGVDGGRLLCSPGLPCPWWSHQHALSAVLVVVSVGCLSRRSQGRERGLRVPNQLNGRQSLLTPPVHRRQQWTGCQSCPHCLWLEGQLLVSWTAARHLHPTGWQLGRSGVSVMILCVLKTVCGWTSKNWLLPYACCGLHFIDSAACVLSFDHSTPWQLWRCEQDERSYPRPQQVEWPRPRPQQTTLMMMASHQHHRCRVPQLTTPASRQHHRRPRLATNITDSPG